MDCIAQLLAQHRETESHLLRLAELTEAGQWAGALACFQSLKRELLRHYVLEEQALFALLSQYRTMMLMEVEHEDLLTLQHLFEETLQQSVAQNSPHPDLTDSLARFEKRLSEHIVEEERGIFPLADSWLTPEEHLRGDHVFQAVQNSFTQAEPTLPRPQPGFEIAATDLFTPLERPVAYQSIFEREHASIQHLWLKAGQKLARHWAGQHQCMIVTSGQILFETDAGTETLNAGMRATLDSRLYFSLQANADSHLLIFKVWPHPHYSKA